MQIRLIVIAFWLCAVLRRVFAINNGPTISKYVARSSQSNAFRAKFINWSGGRGIGTVPKLCALLGAQLCSLCVLYTDNNVIVSFIRMS